MSQLKQRKLSVSSTSTQDSTQFACRRSSRCCLKGIFKLFSVQTEVLLYEDSIAFSNNDGLTILRYSSDMRLQFLIVKEKKHGFAISLKKQHYEFQVEQWRDFCEWESFLSTKLIQSHGFEQKYGMKRLLGKGATGKVYLGEQKCSQNEVAVKVLQKSIQKNPFQFLKMETKMLRKLNHHNIIQLKAVYQTQKAYFIVMEYFKGVSLDNYLYQNKLFPIQRKQVLTQLLQTVIYLHSMRILHRDIKPQNILINQDTLQIKLIDFGLAVQFSEVKHYNWCGTVGYVAPESLDDKVDFRNIEMIKAMDVYSLGAVFYEMIFNQRLYNGLSRNEIMDMNFKANTNFEILKCLVGEDELSLVVGLLQRNPQNRMSLEIARSHTYLDIKNPQTQSTIPESSRGKSVKLPTFWRNLCQLFYNPQSRKG